MELDQALLERFEAGLDPQNPGLSKIGCTLIGYGEISAIFAIEGLPGLAMKRLPLFADVPSARDYAGLYGEYCRLLVEAGLGLPETAAAIVEVPGRPVVLYIAQERLPAAQFGNRLIHTRPIPGVERLIEGVLGELAKVWRFSSAHSPSFEIAVDGQISNWAAAESGGMSEFIYVDTSTPFIRRYGRHQIPADLFLKSAPGFLRGIIRRLFLEDVLGRYFDPRSVLIDLAANLYKEQRPELVHAAVDVINRAVPPAVGRISVEDVTKYYREDRFIWTFFLAARRLDRWLTRAVFRRRYEFILPGKIRR